MNYHCRYCGKDNKPFFGKERDPVNTPDLLDLDDDLIKAIEVIKETGKASATLLQRRLDWTFIKSARIMDQLEHRKIVGPQIGAKPREIFIFSIN